MNLKDPNNDSGNYVNGTYTSKNGFSGSGLNCPKGVRLYYTNCTHPVIIRPKDSPNGEHFKQITPDIAPDVLPYYAISNYGRVLNINSGLVMKPNYRPNGYEYYCLAAEGTKYGQKKYSTQRLVMKAFYPVEDSDKLQVNHIDGIKSHNFVDKIMEDGSIISNLEWCTASENCKDRTKQISKQRDDRIILSDKDADKIRDLYNQGYTYEQIRDNFYSNASVATIQKICKNEIHKDADFSVNETRHLINPCNVHKLTDEDVSNIRSLLDKGYSCVQIRNMFYPDFALSTMYEIQSRKIHNK